MNNNVLELIPINHEYTDPKKIPGVHLSRLSQLKIREDGQVNEIYFILFNKEGYQTIQEILKGALQLIGMEEPKEFYISLNYPEIIRNIKNLRVMLERDYLNWKVYLNLSPMRHHLHSFLLRDGLKSQKYELIAYEIFNFDYRKFSYVIIPDHRELELIDYEIMDLFIERKNEPLNLKKFVNLEAPGWNKSISTYNQKLRNRLNYLVEKGLLYYKVGPNNEKFYNLKYFGLDGI